ncbi:GNAT family protein [Streptomyces sp. MS2.AVA.5]|uniref:GNAT family protein n=1 Tax=Streptomyces achmelvichensis TaxID=3134111 RepID=A0ACC6PLB6_9ACTN
MLESSRDYAKQSTQGFIGVSERVAIRLIKKDDFPCLRRIWADELVMRHMTSGALSEQQALEKFGNMIRPNVHLRRSYPLTILQREGREPIGTYSIDFERHSGVYTHSMVIDRSRWNTGLATEAYRLLLTFAFSGHKINRVWTACDIENDSAKRMLARVGLSKVGTIAEYAPRGDGWVDCDIYSLVARSWNIKMAERQDNNAFQIYP